MGLEVSTYVGICAAICSVTSFLPQAWRIVKTRDTGAISAPMYGLTVIGFALWVTYGVFLGTWPIIVPNSICFLLATFILSMTLASRRRKHQVADVIESVVSPPL